MSSTTSTPLREGAVRSRVRNVLLASLFACVLVIPKVLHLRQNAHSWMLLRIVMGILGASLVILPLSLRGAYLLPILGLILFSMAILLPSPQPDTASQDRAKELGALVIVNGGEYQPGNAAASRAQLFVGVNHIWTMDTHLQPLLVIPVEEISEARALALDGKWVLQVRWAEHTAEFSYDGIFGEHLARVAESTLQSVMRPALPVIPQRKAATA